MDAPDWLLREPRPLKHWELICTSTGMYMTEGGVEFMPTLSLIAAARDLLLLADYYWMAVAYDLADASVGVLHKYPKLMPYEIE